MSVEINVERKGVEIRWDPGDYTGTVVVYAEGMAGDVHNTAEMPNDGFAVLSYPADFVGTSSVEVRMTDGDGDIVDEGEIEVD